MSQRSVPSNFKKHACYWAHLCLQSKCICAWGPGVWISAEHPGWRFQCPLTAYEADLIMDKTFAWQYIGFSDRHITNQNNELQPRHIQKKSAVELYSFSRYVVVQTLCPALCDSMDCSTPGFPVLRYLHSLKFMSIVPTMPSNHLILYCPLLLLHSIAVMLF